MCRDVSVGMCRVFRNVPGVSECVGQNGIIVWLESFRVIIPPVNWAKVSGVFCYKKETVTGNKTTYHYKCKYKSNIPGIK